jgi:predicted TIM-barrel fold metal-dependent hydrolase
MDKGVAVMGDTRQIVDIDSHEMTPVEFWESTFGPAASEIGRILEPLLQHLAQLGGDNRFAGLGIDADDMVIDNNTVWNVKGAVAPSAIDMARRTTVMDQMGVGKQLVFPTFALFALTIMDPESWVLSFLRAKGGGKQADEELAALGRAGLDEYNDWALRMTAMDPERLRIVAYLAPADNVEALMSQTTDLIDKGVRAVHLAHGVPPGGRSPAHPELDEFWSALASNQVVCTTHLLGESGFKRSNAWVDAPAFAPGKKQSHEVGLEPYSFSTLHLAISNFLACMTLGGVFERHPELRFGAIELGAGWFGPLAENLDMWARDMYAARLKPFISKLPSAYLRDNVRVAPFNMFEPVDEYFNRYPHLSQSYCFSTDFPHVEGGKEDTKSKQYKSLRALGGNEVDLYFSDNGALLFP